MNQAKRSLPGIAFIDFLTNLVILFLVLTALFAVLVTSKTSKPSIETLGYYAVVVTWPNGSPDDVDTYVEDPHDHIVNFLRPSTGFMHLEQDDLGTGFSNVDVTAGQKHEVLTNQERVIIQGIIPGEYVVNVHLYSQRTTKPVRVTIKLYRLIGNDAVVVERQIVLSYAGQERTAFRFTLNAAGTLCCVNHLQRSVVYAANPNAIGGQGALGNVTSPEIPGNPSLR